MLCIKNVCIRKKKNLKKTQNIESCIYFSNGQIFAPLSLGRLPSITLLNADSLSQSMCTEIPSNLPNVSGDITPSLVQVATSY